jgi:hypothetical protein
MALRIEWAVLVAFAGGAAWAVGVLALAASLRPAAFGAFFEVCR